MSPAARLLRQARRGRSLSQRQFAAAAGCHQPAVAGIESGAVEPGANRCSGLAAESGAVRVALCVTPPAPTGDRRYDAHLAALVEHHLSVDRLPVPDWVHEPSKTLPEPWRPAVTAGAAIALQ